MDRCGDHPINADLVKDAGWGEVVALLSEPDRLLWMAHDYRDLEPEREATERETLESVDRRLAALGEDRTDRVAVALEAGVDASTLKAALAKPDEKERTLRAFGARLAAQAHQRESAGDRARRLEQRAASAQARLGPCRRATAARS